jgi:glycerophosphoryl diester phosphodiesterase
LLFSSFRPEALAGARETAPHIPRALLLDTLWPGWLDVALQLGCSAVITNYHVMSAQALGQIHGAAMRGLVYTVNDPAPAAWLQSIGIDGIITDAVDRFSPVA